MFPGNILIIYLYLFLPKYQILEYNIHFVSLVFDIWLYLGPNSTWLRFEIDYGLA